MSDRIEAINMPRWGMTMTEGKVVDWLVDEGSPIGAADEIVEIETTKIANVMEAGAEGVLRRIVVEPGRTVPVGTLIAVVADAAVGDADIDRFVADRASMAGTETADAPEPARLVDAGLRRVNVLTRGDGPGTPVVLVHGFGGDLDNFLFNIDALAEGRVVHAFDLPAHGGSPPDPGAVDVETLVQLLADVMAALGVTRAHLVGHSLGGAVATGFTSQNPGGVASLSLIAPAGFGPEIGEDYANAFLAAERRKDVKAVLGKLFADPDIVSKDMIANVQHAKRVDGALEALRAIADAVFPHGKQAVDLRGAYQAFDVPRLVIWGAKDRILAASHAEGLGGQVEIIGAAGHMPHMEAAAEVNRIVGAHIAKAEG